MVKYIMKHLKKVKNKMFRNLNGCLQSYRAEEKNSNKTNHTAIHHLKICYDAWTSR